MTTDPLTTQGHLARSPGRSMRTALIALALVAFVILAVLVGGRWSPLMSLDSTAEGATHAFIVSHRWLLPGVEVITDLGSPTAMDLVVLMGAVALLWTRRIRPAIYLVAARLLELAVETVLKDTIARPRPVWSDPVATATSSSFPSGHSAGTAVVYLALLVLGYGCVGRPRQVWHRAAVEVGVIGGAMLLIGVPVSRVLLGVHFPSDVIAGVVLGLTCALALTPLLFRPASPTTRPH